jgi:protein-tyrosine phosphatase
MRQRQAKNVLFLCTGNYYRSRFAEILFNSVAGRMGLPWRAVSRGLALERGVNNVGPMAVVAVKALEARGIRTVTEFARFPIQVKLEDFELAEWIVALNQAEHLPLLQERFPDWIEKVEFWQVDDAPEVLAIIEQEVMDLTARLIVGGKRREAQEIAMEARPLTKEAIKTSAPVVRLGRETKGRRARA